MKGKKIKRIICALIVAAVSCLSGALFVACDKNNEENGGLAECYYAYYGERFILPQTDGEYYVADAEGNEVELVLGGFTVSSAGDYKISVKNGSRKEASVIKVLKRNAVNFVSERKLTFASLGAETALPAYKAIVGGEETQAETVLVSPSEKEIGKNLSSFVPEETGNYVLRATANGESDESIIEVGESASYKNLLAPMDREESESMFVRRFGVSMSLNTDDRYTYGTQEASMKLVTNMEANTSGGFQMTNFADPDISKNRGFYFYVYNAGTTSVTLDINWMTSFTLKPKAWTRVSFVDYNELCAQSGNSVVADFFTDKNINGLLFNFYWAQGGSWQGIPSLELYFSDFYRMPNLIPSELNGYIDELPACDEVEKNDATTVALRIEELETMYYSLSEYQRALVDYSRIAALKKHMLLLDYPDLPQEEDAVVYFNSEAGLAQTDIYLNPADTVNVEVTDKLAYGNEGASTHVWYDDVKSGRERWDFNIVAHTPMINDFSFGYDTYYMYVYNDGESDALYYAWTDDSAGWVQPIYKGRWNLIYLTDFSTMSGKDAGATRFNVTNFKIAFAVNPWNANAGASFYFSNIRALNEKIVEERLKADNDKGGYFAETVRLYDILSDKSKRNIEAYDKLLAAMFNRVSERIVSEAGTADEKGLGNIFDEIELLDDIYKFASNAAKAAVENSYRKIAPAYVNRFTEIYDAESADKSLIDDMLYLYGGLNAAGRMQVSSDSFGEFYKKLLVRFGLDGKEEIASFSTAEGVFQAVFRIQSDTGVRDEDWEKIFDYKKVSPAFEYTTEKRYSTDSGSAKLTIPVTSGWDVLKMYLTLPAKTDLSSADYDTLYFYVYNDSSVDYTLEVHYTKTFTLKKNAWTKVWLDDWTKIKGAGTRSDVRGICFDIHQDWNLQIPADLYFSSILPANAYTVNSLIDKLDAEHPDTALLSEIRGIYEMLSENQKRLASRYRDVALAIMKNMTAEYGADITEAEKLKVIEVYNAVESSATSDALEKWYASFYENIVKSIVDPNDKKIFYYGSAYGFDQISVKYDDANGTYGNVIFPRLSLSDKGVYDESASLRLTSDSTTKTWASVYVTLKNPLLTKIDGEGIYTYVYNAMSHDVYALLWPNRITLKAKSWNLLYIDKDSVPWVNSALQDKIDLDAFTGFTMELFYYNVNGVTQLYDGLDVYFTPFKQATEASLQNAVDYFNGGSGTEEERLFAAESAVLMYEAASGKTKSAITDYAAFAAAYYAKLDSTYGVGRENKIVGFDTEGGAKQVYISIAGKLGSDVSYTEKPVFSKDRAYGNENGSTRFKQGQFTTDTANVWYTIRVALSKDVAMYNKIRFAVYNESSNAYNISLGDCGFTLESNRWTEVEFDISDLTAGEKLVFKVDCGNKLGRDALWFSAIYGIK